MVILSTTLLSLRTQTQTALSRIANVDVPLHSKSYNGTSNIKIASLPDSLYSDALQRATSVVTLLVGVCALCFTIVAWPGRKEVRTHNFHIRLVANTIQAYRIPPCKGYPIAHVINHIYCVLTLVMVTIMHQRSSHFNITTLLDARLVNGTTVNQNILTYSSGTFDLETWTCDLAGIGQAGFMKLCQKERAQRYLLIPLASLNLICLCTGLIARHLDIKLEVIQDAKRLAEKSRMSSWTGLSDSPMPTSVGSPSFVHQEWAPAA